MAERLERVSPLALAECVRRLELLSQQPELRITERGKTTRVVVSRFTAETAGDDSRIFKLNARCHDYTYRRLGGMVFMRASGRLERLGDSTRVRFDFRLGPPVTHREWLAQISWYAVFTGVLLAYLFGSIRTEDQRLWELAGGFALLYGLMYVLLARVYFQARAALASTLEKTLALSE